MFFLFPWMGSGLYSCLVSPSLSFLIPQKLFPSFLIITSSTSFIFFCFHALPLSMDGFWSHSCLLSCFLRILASQYLLPFFLTLILLDFFLYSFSSNALLYFNGSGVYFCLVLLFTFSCFR